MTVFDDCFVEVMQSFHIHIIIILSVSDKKLFFSLSVMLSISLARMSMTVFRDTDDGRHLYFALCFKPRSLPSLLPCLLPSSQTPHAFQGLLQLQVRG